MRRIGVFFALACAAGGVPGCGWKMVDAPIRVRGQVIDADTKAPVEGAYIDIADDREKLDIRLHTAVRTDSNGAFDTTFVYAYERWAWLGIPVWWLSTAPERIYVEVTGNGYRPRVTNIDYRAALTGGEKEPPPVTFDPIAIHRSSPPRKSAPPRDEP
jgi:hypothetical protein